MKRILSLLLVFWCLGAAAERFVPAGISEGLSSRRVYRVRQDGEGFLWFFLADGVDRYDGLEFRHYAFPKTVSGTYVPSSSDLAVGPDGRIRCLLSNGDVFVYDSGKDSFVEEDMLSGDSPFSLLRARLSDGSLLDGTEAGLYRRQDGHPRKILDANVTALCEMGNGIWVVGTFSSGAFAYNSLTDAIRPLSGVPRVPVRAVVRDGNQVWFGLDGSGVVRYDFDQDRVVSHYVSSDEEGSLCADAVSDLCLDRRGVLWVTTTSNGICYLDTDPVDVGWVRHRPGVSSSLLSDDVSAILEDRVGSLWFGTGRGICRYSPSDGTWRGFPSAEAENVLALAEADDGSVWAGGYGFSAFRVRPSGIRETVSDSLDYVFALSADTASVWVGGLSPYGRYDALGRRLTAMSSINIWDYHAARDALWAASSDGLLCIDRTTGADTRVSVLPEEGAVWCLTGDGQGRIWLGHEGGVTRYDPSTGERRTYSFEKTVISIAADRTGMVWAVSDETLYRLDPEAEAPVVMNRYLGIGPVQFNHTASARLSDGSLMFGSASGALRFFPERISQDVPDPVVPLLTGFRLMSGNAAAQAKVMKNHSVHTLDRVTLPAVERSFAVSFSALAFGSRSRVLFEYRLDGHDLVDRTSLTATTVEYPSVPPGRYVFRVRCVDSLTGSVLGARELDIQVLRPPLLSTVAKLLYALLLTGIILLFIRFRRKEAARRMTRDRLDTFIRFAHELKTPVSLIKAPLSDLQRDETLPADDRESVSTAMRNADRLMSMINSLLDLREDTPEAGKLYLETTELREYLEDEVEPFQTATRQKGITLTCTVDERLGPVPLDREKMDRILQNLVSNAVKYTEKGLVEVTASPSGKMWRLVVRDTGIGIPAEARSRIFNGGVRAANARDVDETGYGIGLMITRQLVLQLGGSISLKSEEGSGSAFTLLFPMEYRASGDVIWALEPEGPAEDGTQAAAVPNRILVVEDDPEMLAYLKSALGGEFKTLTASDGETAFRLAEESQPDLVLSDVIMPGMNGYDLCRRLKSTLSTSHIPVILLTAMDDREHIILGLESGSDDYVVKPFDPQVLSARISNLLHERERLRSLLLRAGREEKRREYSNQLDRDFMEKVLAVMEKSFADPLFQVDDLCRDVAMSRTAFYNKLKAVTGKAPNDFIRIFRLERAAELLSSGELTVSEAADRVGFSDPKYFSSCFRRHFGVSPSKY